MALNTMIDVLVIGGGHAGVEAAASAVRMGARTALLTFSRANIGMMSCNPAIGGLGKGHIVREVDAFDGLMARAADAGAIHHRLLNASKGSAVHGPRVQTDRRRYAAAIRHLLQENGKIEVIEGEASSLLLDGDRCGGIVLHDGAAVRSRATILATGTFLAATMFCGTARESGGRVEERAASLLAQQLRSRGLPIDRLKTGTPPRLDGRTIDWAALAEQPSDDLGWTMSPLTGERVLPQVACAVTRTNGSTHEVIRANLDRSPLFSGSIEARGPRYCPSIEDKIHRFGDRDGHQVFLEPEGLDDNTVYPNGISTSLPADVQEMMVKTIPGLDRARIVRSGYAVEYDYLDPRSLDHRLAVRDIPGLFCAGQINGTTGYEEAAGQGLVAGLNAAAEALDREPILLDRATSYIGVMVDDLVVQGVSEPYRMLTARAESRLALRADNAETRLGSTAERAGCLSERRQRHQQERSRRRVMALQELSGRHTAAVLADRGARVAQDGGWRSGLDWLRFDGVKLGHVAPELASEGAADDPVLTEILDDARYAPYLARQAEETARLRQDERIQLPANLRFADIPGLSNEMVERLSLARPDTLAAASRIRGITPAALTALLLHAKRR